MKILYRIFQSCLLSKYLHNGYLMSNSNYRSQSDNFIAFMIVMTHDLIIS